MSEKINVAEAYDKGRALFMGIELSPPKLPDDLPQIVRVLLDSSSYFGCARRFGFLRRFFTRVRLFIGRVHNRAV